MEAHLTNEELDELSALAEVIGYSSVSTIPGPYPLLTYTRNSFCPPTVRPIPCRA